MDRLALIGSTLNSVHRLAPRSAGAAAYALFRFPWGRRARMRPAEEPVMRAARESRLQVNGNTVRAYAWGDGRRPVLLLHGWRDRASRWAPLVTALRERGYSPVAFDAPGHGRSGGRTVTVLEYEEAARLLQAEHGHFEAVVSHSFGSLAAFWALRHTVTADRLISVSGVGEVTFTVDSFAAALGLAPGPAAEFRRQVERRLLPGETRLWSRFSARHRTREITVPMLLIHDERDRVVPVGQTERVAEAYPLQADVLITRGLGHGRILGAPQTVAAVCDFLAATAGPPAPRRTADAAGPAVEPAQEPEPAGAPARPVTTSGPPEPAASRRRSSVAQGVG